MQTNKGSQFFKILFCAYTLMLFTVTLLPVGVIQSESNEWLMHFDFKNQDKVFHILLFFGFALLLRFSGFVQKNSLIILLPILTGILIEILQHLMGLGRTFDIYDIISNSLGVLLAFCLLSVKNL
ncbi:MAG: VanZ family protein [Weeksellaceae bacterium]|nr:VanZ family protein [Weeksellaceae bacterium]